ncbi:S8 family serine peptidase [Micromonosporaceae bacterium B7E4]
MVSHSAIAAVAGVLAALPVVPAAAAPASSLGCPTAANATSTVAREPTWSHHWLAADRLAPHTGAGITVAVVDTGVNVTHPQLAGRVLAGYDVIRDRAGATVDHTGHGTAVASIIAARPMPNTALLGLAPGVRILPVRVSDCARTVLDRDVNPVHLADGIRWAADHGARVVNVSLAVPKNHSGLRAAVAHALRRGVVVVAATGDARTSPTSYPAAYPGVIAVGALDEAGNVAGISTTMDLVAPGDEVLAAAPRAGHIVWAGTDAAAPVVSATAALVRAALPKATVDEIRARLTNTATPIANGPGAVDPYRALRDMLASPTPVPQVVMDLRQPDRPGSPWPARAGPWAGLLGAGAVLVLTVLWLRSRWRTADGG